MRNSGDVSVVMRTNSVEGSGLGEGEEEAETSKEQNLDRKVVFKIIFLPRESFNSQQKIKV